MVKIEYRLKDVEGKITEALAAAKAAQSSASNAVNKPLEAIKIANAK